MWADPRPLRTCDSKNGVTSRGEARVNGTLPESVWNTLPPIPITLPRSGPRDHSRKGREVCQALSSAYRVSSPLCGPSCPHQGLGEGSEHSCHEGGPRTAPQSVAVVSPPQDLSLGGHGCSHSRYGDTSPRLDQILAVLGHPDLTSLSLRQGRHQPRPALPLASSLPPSSPRPRSGFGAQAMGSLECDYFSSQIIQARRLGRPLPATLTLLPS